MGQAFTGGIIHPPPLQHLRQILAPRTARRSAWVQEAEGRSGRLIDQNIGLDFGETAAQRSFCL